MLKKYFLVKSIARTKTEYVFPTKKVKGGAKLSIVCIGN